MQATSYQLQKYTADEGMCFDWKEPRFVEDEEGNQIQEHLHCTVLWIGHTDSIDNYIEVEKPTE